MRLHRRQEAEGAALVLSELPFGDRAQQGGHGRVQRPAGLQRGSEVLPYRGAARADGFSDSLGSVAHPWRRDLRFDRAADELDHLVTRGHEGQVDIAALDLSPIVAAVDAKAS